MVETDEECRRYYMARRTVSNMEAELRRSLSDFRAEYGDKPEPESLLLSAFSISDPLKKVLIIFCGPLEVTKESIKLILDNITKKAVDKVNLIVESEASFHFQDDLRDYPFAVNIVQIAKLLKVTKDEVMNSEKEKPVKKDSTADIQLPLMRENAAIASTSSGLQRHVQSQHYPVVTFHSIYQVYSSNCGHYQPWALHHMSMVP